MGNNPSHFTGDSNLPVESVTWYEATTCCAKLTERERAAGRISANCVYRLPTEAEWEYACRAWTSTRFSYGDDPGYTKLTDYAWYSDNSGWTTHSVGQKLPNAWGLYDMHGNVWEWFQDWYAAYPGGVVLDPSEGSRRVFRGGGWEGWFFWGLPGDCRSASRDNNGIPETGISLTGFRVVLAPGQ